MNNHEPHDDRATSSDEDGGDEFYQFEKTDRHVVLSASNVVDNTSKFYGDAAVYWNQIPATIDGMLGGYAKISPTDIMGSQAFIRPFISGRRASTRTDCALDCGAGIGRISKRLLLPFFKRVDMVEQCQTFLNNAPDFIGEESSRIGKYICVGLQDFIPEGKIYNLIWVQWVLGHLTDVDFVTFLKRCRNGLTDDGLIVLKENVSSSGDREFDTVDSSFTRCLEDIKKLITDAGLSVTKCSKQRGFPKYLYNVYMIAFS